MRAFSDAVKAASVEVPHALLVYTAESGLNPKASSGAAWGLAQMTLKTLVGLGWKQGGPAFGERTIEEQAPWIHKLLLSQVRVLGRPPSSALELYVLNFSPAAAASDSEVIYRAPTANYEANKGLDRERKGYIARADLQTALDRAVNHPAYRYALQVFADLEAGGKLPHGATESW
jgi:hypothetical protein